MFKTVIEKSSQIDISLLYAINYYRVRYLDSFFSFFSFATTFISIGLILTLLTVSIFRKSKLIRQRAYILATVFVLSAITSFVLKTTIYRERPFIKYPYIEKLSDGGNSSFPSGHTLEAFAMATAFAFTMCNRKIAIVIFSWAILVAYSRMLLGVHYPSDVLAGMVVGILIGWSVTQLTKKYFFSYERKN
jgi:undecaprenyl-diphosphatase